MQKLINPIDWVILSFVGSRVECNLSLCRPKKCRLDRKLLLSSQLRGSQKKDRQTLLGITGSGKIFVMANVIDKLQEPTLILAQQNFGIQLYGELKSCSP